MVQVEHRKRFAGEEHLVVVQPDGTLALIPAWMSEETARSTAITGSPCLSVDRLVELRVRQDALLASSDGESTPHEGGDHAITTELAARPVRSRSKDVGHSGHAEASTVSAIERMLVEALADDDVATHAANDKATEVADEQDHV
jgi:hypothetical protein